MFTLFGAGGTGRPHHPPPIWFCLCWMLFEIWRCVLHCSVLINHHVDLIHQRHCGIPPILCFSLRCAPQHSSHRPGWLRGGDVRWCHVWFECCGPQTLPVRVGADQCQHHGHCATTSSLCMKFDTKRWRCFDPWVVSNLTTHAKKRLDLL